MPTTQAWRALTSIYFYGTRAYTVGNIVPDENVARYGYDTQGLVERVTVEVDGSTRPDGVNLVTQAEFDTFKATTKVGLGLGSVDNTADVDKPVSTKVASALAAKAATDDLAAETSRASAAERTNMAALARTPDALISGTITRDANGAATSAPVVWPDGTPGTYTADTLSTAFPGAVDAYHITYGAPVTKTYTQPLVTRDTNGAATTVPAIAVS